MSMKPTITIHITFLSSGLKRNLQLIFYSIFKNRDPEKGPQNQILQKRGPLHELHCVDNGSRPSYPDVNYSTKNFVADERQLCTSKYGIRFTGYSLRDIMQAASSKIEYVRGQAPSCLNLECRMNEQNSLRKGKEKYIQSPRTYRDEKILCDPHRLVVNEASAEYLSFLGFPYKKIGDYVELTKGKRST